MTRRGDVGVVWQRLAIAALLLGPFIGVLDVLIVTVAVPAIRADLDATFGQAQLVVAGYATAYGVGLITGARYGRQRLFSPLWSYSSPRRPAALLHRMQTCCRHVLDRPRLP